LESSRPLIDARRIELSVDVSTDGLIVEGDLTRLAQVISNLLTNAAKYTNEGGRIRLAVHPERDEDSRTVVIRVIDTGVGIQPEMLSKVFDLFTQVERTVDRAQGGLGVGLALVRHLVQMHGGRVEAHSDGAGTGSEFIVRLPLVSEGCDTPDRDNSHGESPFLSPTVSRRILVADDNEDSAMTLATLLELENHQVQAAYDGLEAVQLLAAFRPEVAFLDIGMPKLDGCGVARWIREQPWGKGIVLVALTGLGQDEDRRRTKDAGFDSHIVKPVDPTTVLQLIADLPLLETPPARAG
jgi:CheY-like chemotaxis protein/anti-sigma regulatory factor (Ser/Thr protein kinase)